MKNELAQGRDGNYLQPYRVAASFPSNCCNTRPCSSLSLWVGQGLLVHGRKALALVKWKAEAMSAPLGMLTKNCKGREPQASNIFSLSVLFSHL